jgi:cell division septation protein DedD
MSDEGFHEIQLNGKQLVFLFMAATVVSVVIFLCGVMVGRGVRAHQATAEAADAVPSTLEEGVRPAPAAPPATDAGSAPPPAATTPPATAAPPEPADDVPDYYKTLTDAGTDTEAKVTPPPAPERRAEAPPADPPPAPAPAAPPAAVVGGGFVVQVAALRDRTEADAIVRRLAERGYQAFVVNPVPGKPPVYKVQVGRFAERADADKTAARLKSQEQFSPWVTR